MKAELDKARDNVINTIGENTHDAITKFKKRKELQEYLNSYGVGSFEMACENLKRYLQVKKPTLDIFLIDVVKIVFLNR